MVNDLKTPAFSITLKNLRFFSFFPEKWSRTYLRKFFFVTFFVRLLTLLSTVGAYGHFFKMLNTSENVPAEFLCEDIAYVAGYSVTMYCMISFWLRSRKWANLMKNVANFRKFGKPQGFDSLAFLLNIISYIVSLFNLMTIIILVVFKLIDTDCPEKSAKEGIQNVCLFSPIWFPNIEKLSDIKLNLLFAFQVLCVSWYVPANGHMTFLCLEMTEIIMLRTKHLNKHLEEVFDYDEKFSTDQKMRFCIRYHQEMLRISCELVYLIKSSFLYAPVSAVVLASLINIVMLTQNLGVFFIMVTYLVCLFILCYTGQKIESATLSVANGALASKWYRANIKNLRAIRFVIMRSQKPVELETYPWGYLNYNFYMTVIKAAYSYWTLIRA